MRRVAKRGRPDSHLFSALPKVLLTLRVRNISRSEMSTILVHNQIEKEHCPPGTSPPLPFGEGRGEGLPVPPGWSYYTNV